MYGQSLFMEGLYEGRGRNAGLCDGVGVYQYSSRRDGKVYSMCVCVCVFVMGEEQGYM